MCYVWRSSLFREQCYWQNKKIKSVKDALNKAGIFSTQTSTILDRGIAVVCSVILKHAIEFFREFQDV